MASKIVNYIGLIILLLNVILYLKVSFKHNTNFKIFSLYLLIMCIIQMISFAMSEYKINNLFLSHYYFLFQFLFLSLFYIKLFKNKTHKKIILSTLLIVICIISSQYILNPSLYYKFNILEIMLSSIPLMIFNLLYLFNSLNRKMEYLYVNSGIFIYLLSSTLIFFAGNYINEFDQSTIKIIWIVNIYIFAFYQILIFIEWYKNFRIKK